MATAEIRLATADDAAAIREIYAPIVLETAISFEFAPPDTAEIQRRVVSTLRQCPWLVCQRGDAVLGFAYAGAHRARAAYQWSVEPSVYIGSAHRRQRVAHALYESLFALLRLQGYYNAFAGITLPNDPSVGFHEAFGFEPIGVYRGVGHKFGQWHDVGWWSLDLLRRRSGEVAPPVPIHELTDHAGWTQALGAGVKHLRDRNRRTDGEA